MDINKLRKTQPEMLLLSFLHSLVISPGSFHILIYISSAYLFNTIYLFNVTYKTYDTIQHVLEHTAKRIATINKINHSIYIEK